MPISPKLLIYIFILFFCYCVSFQHLHLMCVCCIFLFAPIPYSCLSVSSVCNQFVASHVWAHTHKHTRTRATNKHLLLKPDPTRPAAIGRHSLRMWQILLPVQLINRNGYGMIYGLRTVSRFCPISPCTVRFASTKWFNFCTTHSPKHFGTSRPCTWSARGFTKARQRRRTKLPFWRI